MRKVILYVAVSLDGYIADAQKSVHWIKGQDDSAEMLDTYTPFFASVDTCGSLFVSPNTLSHSTLLKTTNSKRYKF